MNVSNYQHALAEAWIAFASIDMRLNGGPLVEFSGLLCTATEPQGAEHPEWLSEETTADGYDFRLRVRFEQVVRGTSSQQLSFNIESGSVVAKKTMSNFAPPSCQAYHQFSVPPRSWESWDASFWGFAGANGTCGIRAATWAEWP